MSISGQLKELIAPHRTLRTVEDGIYSVLRADAHGHLYDRRAALYDLLVSTRLYNRLMWGDTPGRYAAFAQRAFASHPAGFVLDAPCGSLLFTAHAYLQSTRPIVALDQSIAMLRRARTRLLKLSASMPDRILLLQADLSDPPFLPASFPTILCMNVLHQYADAATLIANLNKLLSPGGNLYLTSLVTNRRPLGDHYLKLLHASGEFVPPRSSQELEQLLQSSIAPNLDYRTHGNMAYAATKNNTPT